MAIAVELILVPTLLSVAALLTVRQLSPAGGLLARLESADGIYAAAVEGLAVVLGFILALALQSYANARNAAGEEAAATQQLYSLAGFFPPSTRQLRGEVVCYARSVIDQEWPAMARGRESPTTQAWANGLDKTIQHAGGNGNRHGAATLAWLDASHSRLEARRTRIAEGHPFVPNFAWYVLVALSVTLLAFHCLLSDPASTVVGQAVGMTAVSAVLFTGLALIWIFDAPFSDRGAQIAPARMQATLAVISHQANLPSPLPCDQNGSS